MILRKITMGNSFRYFPKSQQTRDIKQNTIKNKSTPRKQNENISQHNKKFLKNISAQGFKHLE